MKRFILLPDDAQTQADLADLSNWGVVGAIAGRLLLWTTSPALRDIAALRGRVLPPLSASAQRLKARLPAALQSLVSADAVTVRDVLEDLVGDSALID